MVRGNPASRIQDIREVEIVFKGGIGYDPVALTRAEHGAVAVQKGIPWRNIGIGPAILLVLIAWRYFARRSPRTSRGR